MFDNDFFLFFLRWLVQAVHGKYFSRRKWERFLKNRAVPGSSITFAEIEVMLCDIPSKSELAEDEKRLQQEEEGDHSLFALFFSIFVFFCYHASSCLFFLFFFSLFFFLCLFVCFFFSFFFSFFPCPNWCTGYS